MLHFKTIFFYLDRDSDGNCSCRGACHCDSSAASSTSSEGSGSSGTNAAWRRLSNRSEVQDDLTNRKFFGIFVHFDRKKSLYGLIVN